ncbi:MAG: tape measure protein [Alistipes sp.]|nr:tape measure protein [Alistipes sp.]
MINLTAVIDNSEALRKLKELKEAAEESTSDIVSDADRMDVAMRKIGSALAGLGLGISLTSFAKQVAMVRGEFQQLEVAFSTMLSSKEKADALMAEVTDFAAKTPFDLQGVAQGTKQLLAYGSTAEEVVGELRMLGDIAAGLSIPLGDIVYLYGTTRTQGRMYTQDLRQFMGRGIPLAEELAKQFGVSKDRVGELVTQGKVGFEEMRKALVSMTSEGGKFYNLMEAQSATITGKMSNLGDAIDQMFNEIGKSQEGVIASMLDGATYLVENYEKVGRIIMNLVAAYGAYKAAVIIVTTWQKVELYLTEQMALEKYFLTQKNHALSASALRAAAAEKLFAAATLKVKTALKGLAATMTNPYVLMVAAIGTAIYAIYDVISKSEIAAKAVQGIEESIANAKEKLNEEREEIDKLVDSVTDANAANYERVRSLHKLVQEYPQLLEVYGSEKEMLNDIVGLQKQLNILRAKEDLKLIQDKKKTVEADVANQLRDKESWFFARAREAGIGQMDLASTLAIPYDYLFGTNYSERAANWVNRADTDKGVIYSHGEEGQKALADAIDVLNEEEKQGLIALEDALFDAQSLEDKTAQTEEKIAGIYFRLRGGKTEDQLRTAFENLAEDEKRSYENFNDYQQHIFDQNDKDWKNRATADAFLGTANYVEKRGLKGELEYQQNILSALKNPATEAERDEAVKNVREKRLAAIEAANEAEIELEKERIDSKAELLEYEKSLELKELDAKIAAADKDNDTETVEAFNRQKEAVTKLYDMKIAKARKEEAERDKQEREQKEEEEKQHLNKMLAEFGTYNQKRQAIIDEYKEKRNSMYATDKDGKYITDDNGNKQLKEGFIQENIDNLNAQEQEALSDFASDFYAENDEFETWLETIVDMSVDKLRAQKQALEELLPTISDEASKGYIQAQINAMDNVIYQQKKPKGKDKKEEQAAQLMQAISEVGSAAKDALENIEGMDEGLKKMFSDTLDLTMGVGNLVIAIMSIKDGMAALEKASAILMIISAAIQVASMLFSFLSGKETSFERNLRLLREFNEELRIMNQRAKLENFEGTIFDGAEFAKAANAINVYNEALKRYNDTVNKITQTANGLSLGQQLGFYGPNSSFAAGSVNDLEDALGNMLIQTRHKTWFRSAKYSSLKDVLPELFGEDGVNMEALKEFTSNDLFENLSYENQQLIKSLLADWELYEDAMSEVRDYLSGIFGEMGSEMTDALVTAFQSGTDAAKDFIDSMSNMLDSFARDMVNSLIFADLFKEAEDALFGVMKDTNLTDEAKFAKYTKIFGELASQSAAMQDEAFALMDALQKQAKEQGFDIFNDADEQTATSRGFQAMSQETGSELNGRFTDMQGKMTEVRDFVFQTVVDGQHRLNELVNIRDIAIQLNGNVEQIKTYSKVLPQMNDTLTSMNRKLDAL